MNPMPADKELLLDLLVDGELDEADRRELLLWCERDPEGWRRCALAFLEAQNWSQELSSLGKPEASNGEPEASASVSCGVAMRSDKTEADASGEPGNVSLMSVAPKNRSAAAAAGPHWRAVGWSLAMAASFLVSFVLGLWARGARLQSNSGQPGAAPANRVAGPEFASPELIDKLRRGALGGADRAPTPATRSPAALDQVRLVVDGPNGSNDEIQLPVVEGSAADADFLRSQPSAIPLEVQRVLERMGHRVQQRRELVPLRMQDGRRLIVPVDEVEVHPAGNRAYQ